MKSNYDNLSKLLPSLTQAELKELQNRIKVLLSTSSEKPSDDDYLLYGIKHYLKSVGLDKDIPYNITFKSGSYGSYQSKSQRMRDFLHDHLGDMTRLEKTNIGLLCARCLADYIQSYSKVSFEHLLLNIDHVPESIERAFPGYISAGLLHVIIRPMKEEVQC